jgi:hypothetical protein
MPELHQEQQIVGDLEGTADEERPGAKGGSEKCRASAGLTAAARLRGTDVKLAAAARSASVTTAMT